MSLLARRISIAAALLLLFGSIVGFQFLKNQKKPPARKPPSVIAPLVQSIQPEAGTISGKIEIQGQLVAYDKIDIFSEVTGRLEKTAQPFKVGSYFQKDQTLLKLDDEEARLALLAQKSNLLNAITAIMPDLKVDYPDSYGQWQSYLSQFEVEAPISPFPSPVSEQEKYFIASKNLYNQYYNIKSAESRLDKYVIRAPFSGVLTEAMANPGTIVRTNQKVGAFMRTGSYELQATVPLSRLDDFQIGSPVQLYSIDIEGSWSGKVKRISDMIDPQTQNVVVYIDVKGNNLKEGMYLKGQIRSEAIENAIEVPSRLLVDQKAVFLVKDSTLAYQPVEVVEVRDTTVVIRGLPAGARLLSQQMPAAFDGMKIRTGSPLGSADSSPITPE